MNKYLRYFITSFIVVSLFRILYGHFSSDKLWGDAILSILKDIFFISEPGDWKTFWGFVVIGAISWPAIYHLQKEGDKNSQRYARRESISIVCAKCDQYLGTANAFTSPCERCGSNRYREE